MRRRKGLPGSWYFSHYMPRSMTPAAPRESHQCDSSVMASDLLKPSPTAFITLTGLNCFGEVRLPCGLQCSLYTLHLYCSSDCSDSAIGAILGMGCWLGFTQQGLAPCKKHQAWPGAPVVVLNEGRKEKI